MVAIPLGDHGRVVEGTTTLGCSCHDAECRSIGWSDDMPMRGAALKAAPKAALKAVLKAAPKAVLKARLSVLG